MPDIPTEAEVRRLATPDPPPGPFLHYLWRTIPMGVINPPMFGAMLIACMALNAPSWVTLVVSLFFGAALGLDAHAYFQLYRPKLTWYREDLAWVEKIATGGPKPWGKDIAWTMLHLIREDKTHVAAGLALGLLEQDGLIPPEEDT